MKMFGTIEKYEPQDDGTIIISGCASSEEKDSQGETITKEAMANALPDYMKFGNIREMHQNKAAGVALDAGIQDDGKTWIKAHIVDAEAIKKVATKVYKGFSIGGKVTSRDDADKSIITGIKLSEISLVDRPANPSAILEMWKSDGISQNKITKAADDNADDDAGDKDEPKDKGKKKKKAKAKADEKEDKSKAISADGLEKADKITYKNQEFKDVKELSEFIEKEQADAKAAQKKADATKRMYDISILAGILESLNFLRLGAEWENEMEGDDSEIPSRLKDAVENLAGVLVEMVGEETAELTADKAQKNIDLEKAGARHSKADKDHLDNIHKAASDIVDRAEKMGADCGKADQSADVTKMAALEESIKKINDDLEKVSKERDELKVENEKLKALPAPAKGALKAVDKGDDVKWAGEQKDPVDTKDPVELIKSIRRSGNNLVKF